MAYNSATKYSGNANRGNASAAKPAAGAAAGAVTYKDEKTIYKTGLFRPTNKDGSVKTDTKVLASIKMKESITIPAGSFINLFDNSDDKKTEKSPDFTVSFRLGDDK